MSRRRHRERPGQEVGRLDPGLRRLFALEVWNQCGFAQRAHRDLREAVAARDVDRAYYSIQMLLVSAANVSKLLWGRGHDPDLHRELGVKPPSLLRNRDLRDDFEHFDERLLDWAKTVPNRIFVDRNVGRLEGISVSDGKGIMRHYDPSSDVLIFRDKRYPLADVMSEIAALRDAASRGCRLPLNAPDLYSL